MNILQSHADKIQASIINAYKIGITHGNPEKYQDLSAYENKIQKLCELEQGFSKEPQIIAGLPTVEIDDLEGIYKELLKEAMNADVKDSDRYRRFEKDIEDIKYFVDGQNTTQAPNPSTSRRKRNLIAEDDDMEIETTENDTNFVDPITKKLITNPVRHKVCNHIYDLISITAAIKNSRKMRCPYIGCSSRAYLAIEDLIEDRELRRKIMQNQ